MKTDLIRSSRELKDLITAVKIEHMKNHKRVPSTREITKKIAEKINKDELLYEKFIRF